VVDPDTEDTHVLTTSADRFDIVDGRLILKPDVSLDRDVETSIDVEITATDSGTPSQSKTQVITVFVTANPFPWHRADNPFDVTGDGQVAPIDVLAVINRINANPSQLELPRSRPAGAPHFDVFADNMTSPLDVLRVINHINDTTANRGEGEDNSLPTRTRFELPQHRHDFSPGTTRRIASSRSADLAVLSLLFEEQTRNEPYDLLRDESPQADQEVAESPLNVLLEPAIEQIATDWLPSV
jgi:hypothetical protein